jgi:hypothetical protein
MYRGIRHLFDVRPGWSWPWFGEHQLFARNVRGVISCNGYVPASRRQFSSRSDGTPQNAALTIVQLAAVPLGIGTIAPSTVAATGGATLTIRGSGFQSATTVTINGKAANVTFKDASTLIVVTPSLTPGPQQITTTNPDGETVSLDADLTAN